jgi:hypothetical protein
MKYLKYTQVKKDEKFCTIGTDLKLVYTPLEPRVIGTDFTLLTKNYKNRMTHSEVDLIFFAYTDPTLNIIDHDDILYTTIMR